MSLSDVYVEHTGGTRSPDGYIVPATLTGESSGFYLQVELEDVTGQYRWKQWVHMDSVLMPGDVEDA